MDLKDALKGVTIIPTIPMRRSHWFCTRIRNMAGR